MRLSEAIDEIPGSYMERIRLTNDGDVVFVGTISSLIDDHKELLERELVDGLYFTAGVGYEGELK